MRPTVSLEEGIEAEYRWLFDHTRASLRRRAFVRLDPSSLASRVGVLRSAAPKQPPVGTLEPDKFLFERGTEELNKKHWLTAREYFRQLIDSYPQSPYRADAKLGLGDTYLGEGSAESNVLAVNEFREFLSFYPTHRARRLRAVQARDVPLLPDARAGSRSDARRTRRSRSFDARSSQRRSGAEQSNADRRGTCAAARSARSS